MLIYGIDFTSRPQKRKAMTCVSATFESGVLRAKELYRFSTFQQFEAGLMREGPWIAGVDFPFGFSRKFIENIGWPSQWESYVAYMSKLTRTEFRNILDEYRAQRDYGDKEHLRKCDEVFGGVSPQKLYGVPVGLMLFEGAPRLLKAQVNIPFLRPNGDSRTVIEAYPGALVMALTGQKKYKNDSKSKQTKAQRHARENIFKALLSDNTASALGFSIEASPYFIDDPKGDDLDALLCAVQAAYAFQRRDNHYGAPEHVDPLEGWISGPWPKSLF